MWILLTSVMNTSYDNHKSYKGMPTVLRAPSWRIRLPLPKERNSRSLSLWLIYTFAGLIVVGSILLMLPISSAGGYPTRAVDAFFTSTSAVCVTGLVVVDTGTYWSSFGQGLILTLIQIGGFGFMTSATLLLLAFGRRIGLRERLLIGQSVGISRLGGVVGLVKRMALFTVSSELVGALVLFFRFSSYDSLRTAVWKSFFHSISAFNNAGFDIFGNFQSLTQYRTDAPLILITAALIFLGGISFIFIADVLKVRSLFKLALDSKLILWTTIALLGIGTVIMLLTQFTDSTTFTALSTPYKVLGAFFHSVTTRTAGFTTIQISNLAQYALFFTMFLMFVGGASGSTAGGIKVNTFGILMATIWSTLKGKEHAEAFGREFNQQQIYRAIAVIILSLAVIAIATFLLTIHEDFSFIRILFETFSAFGTVGLSTGITPFLSTAGKIIIIITMFVGRLGPLALTLALIQRQQPSSYRYPEENVRIG